MNKKALNIASLICAAVAIILMFVPLMFRLEYYPYGSYDIAFLAINRFYDFPLYVIGYFPLIFLAINIGLSVSSTNGQESQSSLSFRIIRIISGVLPFVITNAGSINFLVLYNIGHGDTAYPLPFFYIEEILLLAAGITGIMSCAGSSEKSYSSTSKAPASYSSVRSEAPSYNYSGSYGTSDPDYCSLGKHVVLLLFTFGIWLLIWTYRATAATNRVSDEPPRNPATKLLLNMFVPFYSIYWLYKTGERADKLAGTNIASGCLILGIFFPFPAYIMIQDSINKGVMRASYAPPPYQQPYQQNIAPTEPAPAPNYPPPFSSRSAEPEPAPNYPPPFISRKEEPAPKPKPFKPVFEILPDGSWTCGNCGVKNEKGAKYCLNCLTEPKKSEIESAPTNEMPSVEPSKPAADPKENLTDKLMELKNLLDMEIITQEEFDAKKKQLLGL